MPKQSENDARGEFYLVRDDAVCIVLKVRLDLSDAQLQEVREAFRIVKFYKQKAFSFVDSRRPPRDSLGEVDRYIDDDECAEEFSLDKDGWFVIKSGCFG